MARLSKHREKAGVLIPDELPRDPGVYRFYNRVDQVIYVGKAKNLKRRLSQYRNAQRIKKHWKMRTLVEAAVRVDFEVQCSEQNALLRELQLIQDLRPQFNVSGAFARYYPFVAWRVVGKQSFVFWTDREDLLTQERIVSPLEVHGVYRSRAMTRDAFESWVRLMKWVYRAMSMSRAIQVGLAPRCKGIWKRDSAACFYGVSAEDWSLWRDFFEGDSKEALENLVFELMENPRARAQPKQIQRDLNQLKWFFQHEAKKLKKLRDQTRFAAYPVSQVDRDRLTIMSKGLNSDYLG